MDQKKQIIFVLGGPGSGKGTHSEILAKKYDALHISAGDCLREERDRGDGEYTQLIQEYIASGQILPAKITVKLLLNKIDANPRYNIILIDGFPRTLENYHTWFELVDADKFKIKCMFLNCREDVMEQRLLSRGKTSGRVDDKADVIKARFQVFINQTLPVIEEFRKTKKLYEYDSNLSIDEFWQAFESEIQRMLKE